MSDWGWGAGLLLAQSWDPAGCALPDPQLGARQAAAQVTQKIAETKIQGQPGCQTPAWHTRGCSGGNEWHPSASRSTQNRGYTLEETHCSQEPMPRWAALLPSEPPHLLAGCSDVTAACEDGSAGSCVRGVCDEQDNRQLWSQWFNTFSHSPQTTSCLALCLRGWKCALSFSSAVSALACSRGHWKESRRTAVYRLSTAMGTLLRLKIHHATSKSNPWHCANLQLVDKRIVVSIGPSIRQQRGIMLIPSIRMWTNRNPISVGTWG